MRKKIIEFIIAIFLLAIFFFVFLNKLPILYYNKGNNYYENGSYEKAITYFEKSLKINPSSAAVHYQLANAYFEKKLEDKAIEEYKKSVQYDPRFVWGYKALAHIYVKEENFPEAIDLMRKAEVAVADSQEVKELFNYVSFEYLTYCLDKGIEAFLSEDKAKAYELVKRALQIKPDFAFAHYALGYLYFSEKRYDDAQDILNKAIQSDLRFWPAYKLLGDIYFEKGMFEKAADRYIEALAINNKDSILHNSLGLALMNLERYNDASIHLEDALKLDPKNINIRYSLACVYRDSNRFKEATLLYKNIISAQPDYPNIHNDLGDIYKLQGLKQEAFQEYNQEIEYNKERLLSNPNDITILNNLAYAYIELEQTDKAKELLEQALILKPDYRQAYITLANLYQKSGKYKEALAALDKAKTLSTETHFIDRNILRLKKEFLSLYPPIATVYLKNGRQIKGIIKKETEEKIILEVGTDSSQGEVTLYRSNIEYIDSGNNK